MKKILFGVLLGALSTSISFAKSEKEAVVDTIKSYEKALNGNDIKTILSLYDIKPTFMPQNAPAQIGRDAVKTAYENVFKAIDLDITFEIYEVEVFGKTAWARTSSAGKAKILANGETISEGNNELFIFKNENGKWKIHQYLFSTNLPRK